ncbi:hypothetical protein PPYR_06369, partial [Photinus pyralis]
MVFSNREGFDMLMVLGECRQNYRAAERLYAERYPQRPVQSRKVFQRLADRVKMTGEVQPKHNKNRRIGRYVQDERAPDILAAVALDPHVSTRRLAIDAGMSQMTAWRILNGNKLYPYHVNLHQ